MLVWFLLQRQSRLYKIHLFGYSDPVLVFPCDQGHVTCLSCFRLYCNSRLQERQFFSHPDYGYTLPCPARCSDSFIQEVHHFRLLPQDQYDRYQRFGTEEFILQAGGVLCPQPGCGAGILVDKDCDRVQCVYGCEVSQYFLIAIALLMLLQLF